MPSLGLATGFTASHDDLQANGTMEEFGERSEDEAAASWQDPHRSWEKNGG